MADRLNTVCDPQIFVPAIAVRILCTGLLGFATRFVLLVVEPRFQVRTEIFAK